MEAMRRLSTWTIVLPCSSHGTCIRPVEYLQVARSASSVAPARRGAPFRTKECEGIVDGCIVYTPLPTPIASLNLLDYPAQAAFGVGVDRKPKFPVLLLAMATVCRDNC